MAWWSSGHVKRSPSETWSRATLVVDPIYKHTRVLGLS